MLRVRVRVRIGVRVVVGETKSKGKGTHLEIQHAVHHVEFFFVVVIPDAHLANDWRHRSSGSRLLLRRP